MHFSPLSPRNSLHGSFHVFSVVLATIILAACNKKTPSPEQTTLPSQTNPIIKLLSKNELKNNQSSLISHASNSSIHWQPWSANVFERAKQENKIVFIIIGSGTDTQTLALLDQINKNSTLSKLFNEQNVNVLIDRNCNPEIQQFIADLCLKSQKYISKTLFAWFTYEGYPLAWSGTTINELPQSDETLFSMNKTVHLLWQESPKYILQNSRSDFTIKSSTAPFLKSTTEPNQTSIPQAIRYIISLYDPTSNNIDQISRLSTARYINLLLQASTSSILADNQKKRSAAIARLSAQDTLIRGLSDPIDGGIFDGVQKTSTALPIFTKSLQTQALSMEALYLLYQTTEDNIYLKAANKIKKYIEQNLKLANGDYIQGIIYAANSAIDNPCTWTLEELEKNLTEEELRICRLAFGIKGLGNIPFIDDTKNTYFRQNTLTWKISKSEVAEQAHIDHARLENLLESIMKKLSKLRTNRSPHFFKENVSSAQSLALYVSSLVTAYRATGDKSHLQDAKKIFAHIKNNFTNPKGKLHETRFNGILSSYTATATTQSLVCKASLDLYEVTLEKQYLEQAHISHENMFTSFSYAKDKILFEKSMSTYPVDYQIWQPFNIPHINNFSSFAYSWSNASRLLNHKQSKSIKQHKQALENKLSRIKLAVPIFLIDYLTCYSTLEKPKVYLNKKTPGNLINTAIRLPCQIITMNKTTHHNLNEKIPDGYAAVVYSGKLIGITNKASELKTWLSQ